MFKPINCSFTYCLLSSASAHSFMVTMLRPSESIGLGAKQPPLSPPRPAGSLSLYGRTLILSSAKSMTSQIPLTLCFSFKYRNNWLFQPSKAPNYWTLSQFRLQAAGKRAAQSPVPAHLLLQTSSCHPNFTAFLPDFVKATRCNPTHTKNLNLCHHFPIATNLRQHMISLQCWAQFDQMFYHT